MPYPEGATGADIDALSEPDRHDCGDCGGSEVERLREALEPFARIADLVQSNPNVTDDTGIWSMAASAGNGAGHRVTHGDCRRARAALEDK